LWRHAERPFAIRCYINGPKAVTVARGLGEFGCTRTSASPRTGDATPARPAEVCPTCKA